MATQIWADSLRATGSYNPEEIVKWFELSSDMTKYPGQFLDLSEQGKRCFNFLNERLLSSGFTKEEVQSVLENLKKAYDNFDEMSKKHELVLIDLINEIYKILDVKLNNDRLFKINASII